MNNNLKITISWEYEDKYGGHAADEEIVSGSIADIQAVINKAEEALGRAQKHITEYADKEPLPGEE